MGEDSLEEDDEIRLVEKEHEEDVELQVSVHALAGQLVPDTIKLKGLAGRHELCVLIDTGSTHSFIDPETAKKIGCVLEYTKPMIVTIADGSRYECNAKCTQFEWEISGNKFVASVRALRLGGCDMVLGVDFMHQMGPVTFNFEKQRIQFQRDGRISHYRVANQEYLLV
ncbi:hypothetical protein C2S52_022353 [Perilla frutescens var. hirtella]|nr:hypothetical protein C2S52_022353 [Perilla frutescens var. hirtella]